MDLESLKAKVKESLPKLYSLFQSPAIILDRGHKGYALGRKEENANTRWYRNFIFNGLEYESQQDAINAEKVLSISEWTSKLGRAGREELIILEESENGFLWVQNHKILRGTKIGKNKSKLEVLGLEDPVGIENKSLKHCLQSNGQNISMLNDCLVDLNLSLKRPTVRLFKTELALFKLLSE